MVRTYYRLGNTHPVAEPIQPTASRARASTRSLLYSRSLCGGKLFEYASATPESGRHVTKSNLSNNNHVHTPQDVSSMLQISQGAEAIIYKDEYMGQPCVLKQRISKEYRVEQLDKKINKQRFNQEVRNIFKCLHTFIYSQLHTYISCLYYLHIGITLGVRVPAIFYADSERLLLCLEYIDGSTFKDILKSNASGEATLVTYCHVLGQTLAQMHNGSIFHGDLTTSNMLLDKNNQVVLIDFGLAVSQCSIEDKAVDLYVLERSFISSHPEHESLVSPMSSFLLDSP